MILRRLPDSRLSEVVPGWRGQTVAVIGGGPSLTEAQVETLREHGAKAIAVNDAFLWAPWADVCYAADAKWHSWMTLGYRQIPGGGRQPIDKPRLGLKAAEVVERWRTFAGQKCSIDWDGARHADDVHLLRNRDADVHGMGLSSDPTKVATGRNSGAQAMNIAVLAGAARILLLGIDGGPNKEGQTHFHGGHPSPSNPLIWDYVRQSFSAMEHELERLGIKVINCSPISQIGFEKRAVRDAFAD